MKPIPVCLGVLLLSAGDASGQTVTITPQASHHALVNNQALVNKYCVGCHNDKRASGGFSWTTIDLANPAHNAEASEKVIRWLRAGLMPPAGAPRPDRASANALASGLEAAIDRSAAKRPYAGAPELHRMNRTEYRNSIHELLALDVDVSAMLPPDELAGGFDNMANALAVTPALVQGYVRAASKISRAAIGDPLVAPTMSMYKIPKVVNQMRHVDGAPLGTRGGTSVIHNFPADGQYTFKLAFFYDFLETLYGQNLPANLQDQQIEVSVDGARAAIFTIDPKIPETKNVLTTPEITIAAGPHRVSAAFIAKFDGPTEDQFRQVEQSMVDITAGVPGLIALPHLQSMTIAGPFQVTGVSDTPSRRKIFTCRPSSPNGTGGPGPTSSGAPDAAAASSTPSKDEATCAQSIIGRLARQAFRSPLDDADSEFLFSYYKEGRREGGFEGGIRMAVQAIVANPKFVFRFERIPATVRPGANFRISDLDLASRLSYFLWSTGPDEPLLALASQGKLKDPAVLEREVRRMLADRRSDALVDNFAFQWLRLQSVKESDPDSGLFPQFSRNLGESMTRETKLLFDSILREDRSIVDLLTASYTFVDGVLARHYGIPNIQGSAFRRVPVTDPNRLGLLGHSSILTLTSYANRTSPVIRGKYVMEVLLGVAPPPPPADVPALEENVENQKALPVRERLAAHRRNPACASCHNMMDPIGLALENYNAIGLWRAHDSGAPIDPSGQLFDGTKLNGPASLRAAILARTDAFVGSFTQNLLAYGLGRLIDHRDMPAVRTIQAEAAENDHRFSSFVLGVVKSVPFQMRKADEAVTTASKTGGRESHEPKAGVPATRRVRGAVNGKK